MCPAEGLDGWEQYFIELFDTLSPRGYNLTTGGDGGKKYAVESREKMSKSQRVKNVLSNCLRTCTTTESTGQKVFESERTASFSE